MQKKKIDKSFILGLLSGKRHSPKAAYRETDEPSSVSVVSPTICEILNSSFTYSNPFHIFIRLFIFFRH